MSRTSLIEKIIRRVLFLSLIVTLAPLVALIIVLKFITLIINNYNKQEKINK
jgi:hypothetical protein